MPFKIRLYVIDYNQEKKEALETLYSVTESQPLLNLRFMRCFLTIKIDFFLKMYLHLL